MGLTKYLYHIGITLSMLLNVLAGGELYQTFSARNYQWKKEGRRNMVWLIDWLTMDRGHCLVCWTNWVVRRE